MVLTKAQWLLINGMNTKTGVVDTRLRWQNKEIPYKIDGSFSDDASALIKDALNHIQDCTCLTFVERSLQTDYITFRVSISL